MYSPRATDGLGVFWLVPILISAAASIGGSAVASKIAKSGRQEPDYSALARAEQEKQKQIVMYIAGGAVLAIFILGAMRR